MMVGLAAPQLSLAAMQDLHAHLSSSNAVEVVESTPSSVLSKVFDRQRTVIPVEWKVASARGKRLQCILNAYKDYILDTREDAKTHRLYIVMKDNKSLLWGEKNKQSYQYKILYPTVYDMVSQQYPQGRDIDYQPVFNDDPGLFRNPKFLESVYGDTGLKVKANLVQVPWLPETLLQKPAYLLFNYQNGAAAALQRVSEALDSLPREYKKYIDKGVVTFQQHHFTTENDLPKVLGIAIEINPQYRNSWKLDHQDINNIKFKNQIPKEIVDIFEKNGFIWGGRWYHYDTTYFEYRPEFLDSACQQK